MIFPERSVETEAVIARGESLAAEIIALASALGDLTEKLVSAHEEAKGGPDRDG